MSARCRRRSRPGLRLGYIVASAELIAELRALRRFMLRHPPANNQRAVALFLSLGHHEALVRRLSSAFDERRKRLVHAISAFLPEWRSTNSAGGTSLWLEGPRGTDARALAEAAAARSVIIEPGDRFFDRADKPSRFMRLGHFLDRAAAHRAGHPRTGHGRRAPSGSRLSQLAWLAAGKSLARTLAWLQGGGHSCMPTERRGADRRRHKGAAVSGARGYRMSELVEQPDAAPDTRSRRSGGRRRGARCGPRRWPTRSGRCAPGSKAAGTGRWARTIWNSIHEAVLTVLETIGFANAIPSCIEALTGAGAILRRRRPRCASRAIWCSATITRSRPQFHPARPGPAP